MARIVSPVCRLCRRVDEKLALKGTRCETPKCAMEKKAQKRPTRGGRRKKISDYSVQLREKQKAKYSYGMLERQFRRFFVEAKRQPGITGANLSVLLERRLDNVVYRLGFSESRPQSRQVVRHGHILVNGRRCDVPSAIVKTGDVISWHESSQKNEYFKGLAESVKGKVIPSWLILEGDKMVGRVAAAPALGEIEAKFDGKAIVEYYSK
ncbi:MAG: 30S ribosomal protein S4 [Dehalococcoidia bacterium]|nr:30S ribosomal protein S4 [Dehalococcoidia bacterium]